MFNSFEKSMIAAVFFHIVTHRTCMKLCLFLALLLNSLASLAHELVLNHDFPDPTIIKAQDGYYYAYATQGYTEERVSRLLNLQVARSLDLKTWQHLGDALPDKPSWANRTQRFWAPHIHFANNLYYLYYSAEPNTDDGKCLAVAVSKKPQGPFHNVEKPLICGPSFTNIDPMVYIDPQSRVPLLYWGSAFEPIRVRQLSPDLISFAPGSQTHPLLYPDRGPTPAPYLKLLEGAWILKHQNYYYLFVSGEDCCGLPNPQYAVLVSRSRHPLGPFKWRGNDPRQSVLIEGNGSFIATGHNAFIHDQAGQLWTLYHGMDKRAPLLQNLIPGDRLNRRVMLRSKVNFVNGWPVLR